MITMITMITMMTPITMTETILMKNMKRTIKMMTLIMQQSQNRSQVIKLKPKKINKVLVFPEKNIITS